MCIRDSVSTPLQYTTRSGNNLKSQTITHFITVGTVHTTPPQYTTPGGGIPKSKKCHHRGCGIHCHIRWCCSSNAWRCVYRFISTRYFWRKLLGYVCPPWVRENPPESLSQAVRYPAGRHKRRARFCTVLRSKLVSSTFRAELPFGGHITWN